MMKLLLLHVHYMFGSVITLSSNRGLVSSFSVPIDSVCVGCTYDTTLSVGEVAAPLAEKFDKQHF